MTPSPDERALTTPRLALYLGLYAAFAGLIAFIGWVADIRRLTDWLDNGISIQPNTTIAAMAAGAAVMLLVLRGAVRAVAVLGFLASLIGATAIFQYLTGVDLGIDRLLLFDRPWGRRGTLVVGRMGPPASVAFTLMGIGLLLAGSRARIRRFAPAFGLLVAAIAILSLIGHAFGAVELYTMPRLTTIALQTSTMLFALGLGLVVALPEHQPMRIVRDDGAGGILVRRALPFIVVIPIVLGLLRLRGQVAGLYGTGLGTAMLVSLLLFLLLGLLWWGAIAVRDREVQQLRAEASLREADRRKDEFLATLAHELRNPLAPIRNAIHLLRAQRDAPVHDLLERQVNHMVRLVDDLIEISRISRGEVQLRKERIALADVLNNVVETHRPQIEAASQQLTVALPPDPLPLDGDPVRLSQVFGNLLHNASKYTPAGGLIALSVVRLPNTVTVAIRDSGSGISADFLPRVFEMFARGDGARDHGSGGLGIGLALVRSLVNLHGGSVEARSQGPGTGSQFIVQLPLATGAWEPSSGAPPTLPTVRKRVLVVDDNRDAADSLAAILRAAGAQALAVYSGPAALDELSAFQPTVALLDIGMPDMDGYELAGRMRHATPAVTIIALTGWGQSEDRRRSKEAGFDHHLTKPVDPEALLALLASLR